MGYAASLRKQNRMLTAKRGKIEYLHADTETELYTTWIPEWLHCYTQVFIETYNSSENKNKSQTDTIKWKPCSFWLFYTALKTNLFMTTILVLVAPQKWVNNLFINVICEMFDINKLFREVHIVAGQSLFTL